MITDSGVFSYVEKDGIQYIAVGNKYRIRDYLARLDSAEMEERNNPHSAVNWRKLYQIDDEYVNRTLICSGVVLITFKKGW
jgi:hypothetical protein